MADDKIDLEDVLVTIGHPFGDLEVPLTEWMARGPGVRPLLQPIAARSRRMSERLPLEVVPLEYRNDKTSRRLIAEGKIKSPWA
jgi:hypothetical protein